MVESLKHSFSFLIISSLNSILTTLSTAPLLWHWEILSRIFSEDYTQLTINTGVPFVTINTMLLHNYTIWLGYQISISCSFYAAVGFLGGSHNRRIGNNRLWTSRVQWSITFGWNEEDSNWKNQRSSRHKSLFSKGGLGGHGWKGGMCRRCQKDEDWSKILFSCHLSSGQDDCFLYTSQGGFLKRKK